MLYIKKKCDQILLVRPTEKVSRKRATIRKNESKDLTY